jgi:hypothetical protein
MLATLDGAWISMGAIGNRFGGRADTWFHRRNPIAKDTHIKKL